MGYTSASNASAANTYFPGTNASASSLITGRQFDYDSKSFDFHNFNVQVAYAPPVGFGGKVEYSIGTDAVPLHSYPQSLTTTVVPGYGIPITGQEIDMTQAYGSYAGGPVTVIVGKFETLAGAEVIESPSDLNFSRGILFTYAVPLTMTGGRITYAVNSDLSVVVGGDQGWNTTKWVPANGDIGGVTAEYGLLWNPSKAVSITLDGTTGPPVTQGLAQTLGGFAKSELTLTDLVATYHYTPAVTFVLNLDDGFQTNVPLVDNTGPFGNTITNGYGFPTVGTARWDGAALYGSFTKGLFTFTGRGEYFADNGGFRTGAQRDWTEATGTLAYAPNNNLIFRAEYRVDYATNPFFLTANSISNGSFSNSNNQFGLEAIVKWP